MIVFTPKGSISTYMNIEDILEKYPGAVIFDFGDSKQLSDKLLALVRCGKKTATCAALREFIEEGEILPEVGRNYLAVHYEDRKPALVIETTEVTQKRFCDVDEAFALAEGENKDLSGWRRDHQAYFERNGGFHDEMILVCERFKLIEDFQQ